MDAPYSRESTPAEVIDGYRVRAGNFQIYGAFRTTDGVNFTIHSHGATSCTLLLFHNGKNEPYARIPFPDFCRIGDVFAMVVYHLDYSEFEYCYSFDGPYAPEKGYLFDPKNYILDPYAKAVTGQRYWGMRHTKGEFYKARVVGKDYDWGNFKHKALAFEDAIIYELHVRGFTRDPSSRVKNPGTFAGIREKIPYLKELGVTAVELMPIFEFDEMEDDRESDGNRLYNYWGYNTVCFFAPNTSYSANDTHHREGTELKKLIRELNTNGIEVILDVVFNHTAEGDERGRTFCFKGIDNNIYYMLTPEGKYYNFSGCGNAVNCNHPVVRQMILDCLRYWVTEYRVNGFRFDLASILGRSEDGAPMENPPLLEILAKDPILADTKLIAEAWDAAGLYQVGSFPSYKRWAEWNGKYRDDVRSFLKGDTGYAGAAIQRITGSTDLYEPEARGETASVNFINCHDGFTLYDMYSYNEKHNEANGWGNTDGGNDNRSWNCGEEGETSDSKINALRLRMCKNAMAVLMMSRGPVMFYQGDEFCNTQFGNNNAYCQDNAISWLDWNRKDEFIEHFEFTKLMIQIRKDHPVVKKKQKKAKCGYPDVSIHNDYPWNEYFDHNTHLIGIMYAGRTPDDKTDDVIYVAINTYWEELKVTAPDPPGGGYVWEILADSAAPFDPLWDDFEHRELIDGIHFEMERRSVVILQAVKLSPDEYAKRVSKGMIRHGKK